MQLFLFLNGLAGRSPFVDGSARFFYVGAVPFLAALFLGHLILVSRAPNPFKLRLALSIGLSLLILALIGFGIEAIAHAYHLGTLSPRPFMTRRVQLLVVEPQDNSFPCYEVALAAILAAALWFSSRKWGIAAAVITLLLALDRLFCGNNFLADVIVGALLGGGIGAACVALCTAPRPAERASWRLPAASGALVMVCLFSSYVCFAQSPRFAAKLPLGWGRAATAAASAAANLPDAPRKATRAARAVVGEGEGIADLAAQDEPSAEELALTKRSTLFLPGVEKFLRGKMVPVARPFALLDVEVAPVKAGNMPYRCAAIRFEITSKTPDLRRQTVEVAARLVKVAFQSDSQLQNVDITAILRGDGAQIDGSLLRFAGDEVPVFTASIQRKNLHVQAPRWANDPRLDGGSWLRTRSRLYINTKILPEIPAARVVSPVAAPLITPHQTPKIQAGKTPTPKTPVKPLPRPAKPWPQPGAKPFTKPTAKPVP